MPETTARPIPVTLVHVQHWTPTLWSLRLSRPADFAFLPGHYVRLGLGPDDQDTVWRAYSIVSAPDDRELEFLITLIPDGAFSRRLARLQVGDSLLLDARALGFFVTRQLSPAPALWMLATGTGLGPYMSLLRDGKHLAAWAQHIVVHSVRYRDELAYADELRQRAEQADAHLHYLPVVTRGTGGVFAARLPSLLQSGALEDAVQKALQPDRACVMVCGNPDFSSDMRALLSARGFLPARRGNSGTMLFENYWQSTARPTSGLS